MTQCESAADAAGPKVNPELSLLIGYDDFANGRRAISFLRYLKETFGDLCMFNPQFLRFEDLMRPQVAQGMGSDAAVADMVVILANGDEALPPAVEDWLGKLEPREGNCGGGLFMAMLSSNSASAECGRVQCLLQEAARRSNRAFLCNPITWPATDFGIPAGGYLEAALAGRFESVASLR